MTSELLHELHATAGQDKLPHVLLPLKFKLPAQYQMLFLSAQCDS
jgi:hypothetical protein